MYLNGGTVLPDLWGFSGMCVCVFVFKFCVCVCICPGGCVCVCLLNVSILPYPGCYNTEKCEHLFSRGPMYLSSMYMRPKGASIKLFLGRRGILYELL